VLTSALSPDFAIIDVASGPLVPGPELVGVAEREDARFRTIERDPGAVAVAHRRPLLAAPGTPITPP
jgi:hypothetical protein